MLTIACGLADDDVLLPKIDYYFHLGYSDTKMVEFLRDDFDLAEGIRCVAQVFQHVQVLNTTLHQHKIYTKEAGITRVKERCSATCQP